MAHGRHDKTAPPRDAGRLYESVGSERRALWWGERSGHIVTLDYDGDALAAEVVRFFDA